MNSEMEPSDEQYVIFFILNLKIFKSIGYYSKLIFQKENISKNSKFESFSNTSLDDTNFHSLVSLSVI
jgi:hypothetical protein